MHPGNVTVSWFSPTYAPSHSQTGTNEKEEEDQDEDEEEEEKRARPRDFGPLLYLL